MSSTPLLALVARCRALCRPRSHAPDSELLSRFAQQRDAAAFEELLERYAPLVWGVCRRIAPTDSDGEDAFQATFLALVRQASRLDDRQSLGGWLHTVAVRIARKTTCRVRKQAPQAMVSEPATLGDIADEVGSRELFRLIDEEIERLPATLRQPLILCCLEGRTRDEAAGALGCSIAAVKSRLERGRDLLRRRLQRRGVQLPAAFLVLGLTGERIRAALWAKTMQTALSTPAPSMSALAKASVAAGAIGKGKWLLAALLLATSAAWAVGMLVIQKPAETPASLQTPSVAVEKKANAPRPRMDRHGDPLPAGAITRLGTVRWRHGFSINALAYSPDGKMIAAVGGGRALTLWDTATGKEIRQFPNQDQPDSLAFSPDGKLLATGGSVCRIWDVATAKELRLVVGRGKVVFSPDGKWVATADELEKRGTVHLWEPITGKEQQRIETGPPLVCGLAISPHGKRLASSHMDGTIRLWDPATGKKQHQLTGHQKGVYQIAFSADGKLLASSSEDESIRLWNPATGRQVRILGEKLGVQSSMPIAFAPDGTLLASGHLGGIIRIWDIATGEEKRRWQAGVKAVRAIAFSPDGKTLASGAQEMIRLWDVATGRERHPSETHRGFVHFVRFAADGETILSLGHDRQILWWDIATSKPMRRFSLPTKPGSVTALSSDGDTLAVGMRDNSEIHLLHPRTGAAGQVLRKQNKGAIYWLSFSGDGRLLAGAGVDPFIPIWDVLSGKLLHRLETKAAIMAFSPRGNLLANSTNFDPTGRPIVHLWDVDRGKKIRSLHCGGTVDALSFSGDGKVLASLITDRNVSTGSIQLWDVATGKEHCRHEGHRERGSAIAFSPDGKLVASGSGTVGFWDNSVHVWEAATGRLLRRFEGHHSCIGSVTFSPDGLTVASGAGDSTILLWDITGRRADGRWHKKPLTPKERDACWTALANEDTAQAYDAVWALVAAPEQAMPFLRKQLPPISRPDAKAVARWIADLNSDDFAVRQNATDALSKLGDAAAPALRDVLQGKPSLETRRRLQQLLDQSRDWTPNRLRVHRAIQALEHIGIPSAQEVLQALADGAPGARRTEEAKAALRRLSR